MKIKNLDIEKPNHASIKIKGSKVVYIDPFKIDSDEKADILLSTHEHYDHCSTQDIKKVISESTIIVTVADNQSKLSGLKFKELKLVKPGDSLEIDGVKIEAVPAYNTDKPFHPKENQWVGFIIEMDGTRVYHAGDTDLIPEMEGVKCDIAILPVSGTYVMTAEEAAKAAEIIKPEVAIPMHYGDIVGTENDAHKFKSLCKCQVEII